MRIPYIIGEAGSCHMGSLTNATSLIYKAWLADCDAIKFQYWSDPGAMRARRKIPPPAYEIGSILPEWFPVLADHAHEKKLDLICSVYLPEDVPFVAPLVDGIKIASFEANDTALTEAVENCPHIKRGFISMGMLENEDDRPHLSLMFPWYVLHCVSAYPVPPDEANLRVLWGGDYDGYSDHTKLPETGGLAVAAGAEILEVHFRLDSTPKRCPDYPVALAPDDLITYVENARQAYIMLGHGIKEPMPCESENMKHRVSS